MKKMLFAAAMAVVMCSCGGNGGETKLVAGSLSKMDSLSYATGINIAQMLDQQMGDMPFDIKEVAVGMEEAGLDKAKQSHDEAIEQLQDYFMNKRPSRMQAIAEARAEQDSIRRAAGDTTKVEYPRADEAMFESEEERAALSYAFGQDIGTNLRQQSYALQLKWVVKGFVEGAEGNASMTGMQAMQYLQNYFVVVLPAQNLEASEKWLAKIEKKSGVKKTESGLLYKVEKAGDDSVKAVNDTDKVKVHYTGRLMDGKVFDSSIFSNRTKQQQDQILMQSCNQAAYQQYQKPYSQLSKAEQKEIRKAAEAEFVANETPIEFQLNQVIPGWTEGMKLVGKGGKIRLWIPASLAYGQRGAGRDIQANMALEFEVELIDVTSSEPKLEMVTPKADETAAEE